MGYQALLDSSLNKAFNLSKDLAKEVTFVRKPNAAFNFGTGESEFSTVQNTATKAVIVDSKKPSKDKNAIVRQLLLKSKEVGDISLYDSVTIDSQTWNITEVQKNDGFISLVEVTREV